MATRATALLALLSMFLLGCSEARDDPSEPASSTAAAGATDALVQSGLDQLAAGDRTAAATTFENVLTIEADNLYALYNLGLIAQEDGDPTSAAEYYDRALEVDADHTPALFNRAILTEAADVQAAIAAYRRVVEIDPGFAPAHLRLGFALIHTGETREGRDLVRRGIALDPSLADVESPSYG
jgi:Tfp pilus assembly protein PilF